MESDVLLLIKCGDGLYGVVAGGAIYRVFLDLSSGWNVCTCPIGYDCKHVRILKRLFGKGDFIEVGSEFEAWFSLLYAVPPPVIFRGDLKSIFRICLARAERYLRDYEPKYGYVGFIEASSIALCLSMFLSLLGDGVKSFRSEALRLLDLAVTMTELTSFQTPYFLVYTLWDLISSKFEIKDFCMEERKFLLDLYGRSLSIIEDDEDLYVKVRSFLGKRRPSVKISLGNFYLALYGGILGLRELCDMDWDKLIRMYDVCWDFKDLKCIYRLSTLIAASYPYMYPSRSSRIVEFLRYYLTPESELSSILINDLNRIGINLKEDSEELISLPAEQAFKIIREALDSGFEKALFYTTWICVENPIVLARMMENVDVILSSILYLRSGLQREELRDRLIRLFKVKPQVIKYALIALLQREVNRRSISGYYWVIDSLKIVRNSISGMAEAERHYPDIVSKLIALNKRKRKFLELLGALNRLNHSIH